MGGSGAQLRDQRSALMVERSTKQYVCPREAQGVPRRDPIPIRVRVNQAFDRRRAVPAHRCTPDALAPTERLLRLHGVASSASLDGYARRQEVDPAPLGRRPRAQGGRRPGGARLRPTRCPANLRHGGRAAGARDDDAVARRGRRAGDHSRSDLPVFDDRAGTVVSALTRHELEDLRARTIGPAAGRRAASGWSKRSACSSWCVTARIRLTCGCARLRLGSPFGGHSGREPGWGLWKGFVRDVDLPALRNGAACRNAQAALRQFSLGAA